MSRTAHLLTSAAQGETRSLAVDVSVDGISARGCSTVGKDGYRFQGFWDKVTGAVKPFVTREIEVIEGESIVGKTFALNAMERAGKITCKVWSTIPCEETTHTQTLAAASSDLKTT